MFTFSFAILAVQARAGAANGAFGRAGGRLPGAKQNHFFLKKTQEPKQIVKEIKNTLPDVFCEKNIFLEKNLFVFFIFFLDLLGALRIFSIS